jgi:hypothetical protein
VTSQPQWQKGDILLNLKVGSQLKAFAVQLDLSRQISEPPDRTAMLD